TLNANYAGRSVGSILLDPAASTIFTLNVTTLSFAAGGLTLGGGGGEARLRYNSLSWLFPGGQGLTAHSGAILEQQSASTLTVTGQATLESGSQWTHSANADTKRYTINLNLTGAFNLQSGATITANAKGYAGGVGFSDGSGFGKGVGNCYGGGGGHGGSGGNGFDNVGIAVLGGGSGYDSLTNPTDLGSGGGGQRDCGGGTANGGAGGGAVILNVQGTLTLNGLIAADGAVRPGSSGGGGAGGTINLTAGTLAGSGTLRAAGGGGGGGGGGGRIAITFAAGASNLAASADAGASGGGVAINGGAGTLYIKDTNKANFNLLVLSPSVVAGSSTPISGSSLDIDTFTVTNARPSFDQASIVTVAETLVSSGTSIVTGSTFVFSGSGRGLQVIDGSSVT
ncbi:MAG: hypothetical protein AABZ01_04885, partial [Gemmatimonadota bacterium]